MSRKKLGVFGLIHESNSFSLDPADRERFSQYEWSHGNAAAEAKRGTNTAISGVFDMLDRYPSWQATFFRMAWTNPCGDIPKAFLDQIRDELLADLATNSWDALFLSLHGAATVEGGISAELELLRAIRTVLPDVPIAVSLDLHANLDPEFIQKVDIAIGYKTHPHIDMRAVSSKALRLLRAMVSGELRPKTTLVKLPLLLPSVNMRTTEGPMRDVLQLATLRAEQEGALDVTVFGGFPYGDCTMAGAGITVVTDGDPELGERLARATATDLWDHRSKFFVNMPSTAGALATISADTAFPIAIVDNADNPASGGSGDTPGQLRSLLAADLPWKTAFCFINDPELVRRCHAEGHGARLNVQLGGQRANVYGGAVEAEVEVVKLIPHCTYRNSGPQDNGAISNHGPSVVLRKGNVSIVVTSICRPVIDPEFYAMHDIRFDDTKILFAKAKNHFRAAMAPVFKQIIDVDEPGPASYDYTRLPFKHVPPQLYRNNTFIPE